MRLVLGDLAVPVASGVDRLHAFAGSPPDEYRVKADVSEECLRTFVELIESKSVSLEGKDLDGLRKLADELGCDYVRCFCVEVGLVAKVEELERSLSEERRTREALERRVKDLEKQLEGKQIEQIVMQCAEMKRQINSRFSAKFVDAPFHGLFKQMWLSKGMNPVKAGFVSVTGSSYDQAMSTLLPELIDSRGVDEWISVNSPDAYLMFDFLKYKVLLTGYTLKTYRAVAGMSHLRSWVVEGSCDGKRWYKIDERQDTDVLNSKSKVCVFVCTVHDGFKLIRLRLTGPDHSGTHFIALANVELFGTYY